MIGKLPEPELGTRLRDARRALGYSQADVARALGVQRRSVYTWEAGLVVPTKHLPALAELLRRSVDWLMYGTETGDVSAYRAEVAELRAQLAELAGLTEAGFQAQRELDRELLRLRQQLQQLLRERASRTPDEPPPPTAGSPESSRPPVSKRRVPRVAGD